MAVNIVKTATGTAIAVNGITIDPSGATTNQVLTFNGTSFVPQVAGVGSVFYQTLKNSAGTAQTQRAALEASSDFALTDDGTNTVMALATTGTPGSYGGNAVYINAMTTDSKGRVTFVSTGTPAGFDTTAAYTITGVHTHSAAMTWGTDNTYAFGDATHRAANIYALAFKSGASPLTVESAQANGAATPGLIFNTSGTFSGGSNRSIDFRNGGNSMFDFIPNGSTTYMEINRGDLAYSNLGYINWGVSLGIGFYSTSGGCIRGVGTTTNGSSTYPWAQTWSTRFCGVEQTIAGALNTTIDPTAGETVRVTLGVNINTITVSAGQPGQIITMDFIQDATGGRTMPSGGNWTGIKLAGNAFANTTTANKRDTLTARWDATNNTWVEIGRGINC